MNYKKFKGKISPVMDLDYDLSCNLHTPETLKKKFQLLAKCGFKSINIVDPPIDDTEYAHSTKINFIPKKDNDERFLTRSMSHFKGNKMRTAVKLAKASGLKVNAIFKPYEGGGCFTAPKGHKLIPERPQVDCLGGCTSVTSFIAKHPEYRLKRIESKTNDRHLPVTSIECCFLLDKYEMTRANGKVIKTYPRISDKEITQAKNYNAEIFVSDDNSSYRKLTVKPLVKYAVKKLTIKDPNGFILKKSARCMVIKLSGINIENNFLAVRFSKGNHRLLLIPYSMIKVKSGTKTLSTTISPTYRYQPNITDIYEKNPPKPGDFKSCGFEFAYAYVTGWREWDTFGIARGKEPFIKGALCEAVPAVRKYWLDHIRKLIDYGCDGIDIRIFSHCSGIEDFANYGYNKEVVDKFRKTYGYKPRANKNDFIKLMKVRGKFFIRFVKDAVKLLHKNNRTLQFHLRHCLAKPSLGTFYHENGFWAMARVLPDWKKLVDLSDRVIISDNQNKRHLFCEQKNVALPIKKYASLKGKELWAYCYLQQGKNFNRDFLNELAEDPHINGIYLYEVVYNDREKDGILEVLNPDEVIVVKKHRKLFKELL